MFARRLLAGVCLAFVTLSANAEQLGAPHKNVLVIVLDDLGTDKLGFYGETPPTCPVVPCSIPCVLPQNCVGPYPKTPNLNAIREQGILFRRAYATPVCSPARACIQTGRYGVRTGVGTITHSISDPTGFELSNDETFLAELVRDGFPVLPVPPQGLPYKRGAFGKWHLTTGLAEDRGHAIENGFNRFYGSMGNVGNYFNWPKIQHNAGDPFVPTPTMVTDWQASVTSLDALTWIEAQTNSFLAYVCFNPPHTPLQVPPFNLLPASTICDLGCVDLAEGDKVNQGDGLDVCRLVYRAMIEAVDTEIGNLWFGMSEAKRNNTMLFIIGDNGTPGPLMEAPHITTQGKTTIFETGIRVPLIVAGPLVKTPIPLGGWESSALVSAVDLFRTIARITGANVGAANPILPLDSISFLPVIEDPTQPGPRPYAFSQNFRPNGVNPLPQPSCVAVNERAITDGPWKYVRLQDFRDPAVPCTNASYGEGLVFLPNDPHELTNLISIAKNCGSCPERDAYLELSAEMDQISGN